MSVNRAILLLGSNLNDRFQILEQAATLLCNYGSVAKKSAFYESPAWGYQSNNPFINRAIQIQTTLTAEELLVKCLHIEKQLGRIRKLGNYEDRTIDIDIILFNEEIIQTENLIVPHPKMNSRRFCLIPVDEIASQWKVPIVNKSVAELLAQCEDNSTVNMVYASV